MPRRLAQPFGLVVRELDCGGEEMLLIEWTAPMASPRTLAALAPGERSVFARIVRGESNAEIARARGTSVRTVANQVASILRKTGCASRFELIRQYAGSVDG